MIVKPIDLGMIQQMNEPSKINQHENNRPLVEQQNITVHVEKETETRSEQVNNKDNADNTDRKFEASDKSDNEYYSKNDKDKNKKHKKSDGKVFLKNQKASGQFDVKI